MSTREKPPSNIYLSFLKSSFCNDAVANSVNPHEKYGYFHGPIVNVNKDWYPPRSMKPGEKPYVSASLNASCPNKNNAKLSPVNTMVCDVVQHDENRPNDIKMCGDTYFSQKELRKHIRTYHPGAVMNPDYDEISPDEREVAQNTIRAWVLSKGWQNAEYANEPYLPNVSPLQLYCDQLELLATHDQEFAKKYGRKFHRESYTEESTSDESVHDYDDTNRVEPLSVNEMLKMMESDSDEASGPISDSASDQVAGSEDEATPSVLTSEPPVQALTQASGWLSPTGPPTAPASGQASASSTAVGATLAPATSGQVSGTRGLPDLAPLTILNSAKTLSEKAAALTSSAPTSASTTTAPTSATTATTAGSSAPASAGLCEETSASELSESNPELKQKD